VRTSALAALVAMLAIGAATGGAPARARAWCQMTTSTMPPTPDRPCVTDGIPLRWERACTTYAIERSGSRDMPMAQVRDLIQQSFETWMGVTCGGTPVDVRAELLEEDSLCNQAEYNTEGGNVNSIIFVADWDARDYDPSAYAYTTVWHNTRTGEIYDVDMEINEDRGPYGDCPAGGCTDGTVDLQNVITHEVGHYFGIAHTPGPEEATMWAISPPGEVDKRTLEPDDAEAICSIYPPGDLPPECNFDPRGGLVLTCGGGDEGCGCSAPGTRREGLRWGAAAVPLLAGAAIAGVLRRRRRPLSSRRP
jgi:hypothetical protein